MAKATDHKRAQRIRSQRAEHETRAQAASHLDMARWAYRAQQITESIASAEKALRIYPNYLSAHALLAEAYFNHRRDYRRAAGHFQFLIEHNHHDRSLPYFLGLCYYETGQYQKARQSFVDFLGREEGKRLPAKWQSLRPQAREFIVRCAQALAIEARRTEIIEKHKAGEALQQVPSSAIAPQAPSQPTPQALAPEPPSLRIRFSVGEDHLRERIRH